MAFGMSSCPRRHLAHLLQHAAHSRSPQDAQPLKIGPRRLMTAFLLMFAVGWSALPLCFVLCALCFVSCNGAQDCGSTCLACKFLFAVGNLRDLQEELVHLPELNCKEALGIEGECSLGLQREEIFLRFAPRSMPSRWSCCSVKSHFCLGVITDLSGLLSL